MRAPLPIATALIATLIAGCPPDLGRYEVVADDAATPGRDGGGGGDGGGASDGGGGGDGGVPDGCALPATCGASCPLPWLLAGVEDLPGGRSCGGMVLRYSLPDMDSLCSCAPLRGGGAAPALVRTVGTYPPDTVVVANEEEVVALDAQEDRVLWRVPDVAGRLPVDVFALQAPGGEPRIAVAWQGTASDLRFIQSFEARTGGGSTTWRLNDGAFPLGLSVASMTQSPFTPTRFLALRSDMFASAEVDPWTSTRIDPPHTRSRDGFWLKTVHAIYHAPFFHTTWSGEQSGTSAVFNMQTSDAGFDNAVPLGSTCSNVECEYLHAVPDPSVNTGMFAICDAADGRRVVRFRSTRTECVDVVTTAELPDSSRITRLAVNATTFWAP